MKKAGSLKKKSKIKRFILLIVDEENFVPQDTCDIIEQKNRTEALIAFQLNPALYKMIIIERMPYMDGIGLAEEFIRIRPDIPVILCTGNNLSGSKETKGSVNPAKIREFIRMIRRILEEHNLKPAFRHSLFVVRE